VSPVKYELGFCIPEDDILHSHCRENLKSYRLLHVTVHSLKYINRCGRREVAHSHNHSVTAEFVGACRRDLNVPVHTLRCVSNDIEESLHVTCLQLSAESWERFPMHPVWPEAN
jgi:hypothetical protein